MATNKNKKPFKPYSIIVLVGCLVLLLYFGVSFLKTQSEINAKEAELNKLESIYESQVSENDQVKNAIAKGDEAALAEEYARKKGYVMPDERVYVDITPGSAE